MNEHRETDSGIHKRLLLVLGMHRSGTSALTRGARVFGANFSGRLVDAQIDNPKGFWEDADLMALHQEIFEALGMAWNRLTPVSPAEVRRLEALGFRGKAEQLLRTKMAGGGDIHAFKHPRMAKLFPFWKEVFATGDFEVICLLAVRNPLSVARSLTSRNGTGKTYSCLMWLSHVIPSLFVPDPSRAIVVDYDRLLTNPSVEIQRIATRFGFSVDAAELEEYQNDFLAADFP
jgi:O-antigen biosynthesis protein